MKRFFVVLSDQNEPPTQLHKVNHQQILILGDRHPSPDEVKELMKKYRNYAFIYLFKGEVNVVNKDNIQFTKYEFLRKYNCASFGIADGPCKDQKKLIR
jgi:hypothetical protein